MCLVSSKVKKFLLWTFPVIKRAKKDTTVYKILKLDKSGPFIGSYKYERGYNFPKDKDSLMEYKTAINPYTLVGPGWLHAYTNPISATLFSRKVLGATIVEKMIIPKGTRYILGYHNQICTKCLKW